jgi:hypothetical protein
MWAAILIPVATFVVASAPRSPAAVLAGIVAGYFAASRLVETLRLEIDNTDAARRYPYRFGTLVLLHIAVPWLLLTAIFLAATGAALALDVIPSKALWPALACCPLAAGALVTWAATAQRGRVPPELFTLGPPEAAASLPFLFLAMGPLLALITIGVPAIVASRAIDKGSKPGGALFNMILVVALATAGGLALLRARRMPD